MKFKFSELKSTSVAVFAKSPIEVMMSLMFLLFGIWLVWNVEPYFGQPLYKLKFFFFACVGLSYTLNIAFPQGRKRIFYYVSILSPVVAYLYLIYGFPTDLSLIVTTLCAVFLMFIGNGLRNNEKFTRSAISRTVNLFLSGALAGIAIGAVMAVYASFTYIFNIESASDRVMPMILDFGMYAFFPFLFLLFEYNEKYEIARNRFSEILFNYILTPAIVLFGVILYLYFAKIIFLWELPKGGVSATAIAFLAGGIFVKACRGTLDKQICNWFFDAFSFIALPALGMLWVAVMYRVMEYGFTDKRVYLVVSVVVLTVWILAQFFKRTNVYHHLTVFTVSLFLIFTYVPYINANAVQKRVVVNEPEMSENADNKGIIETLQGMNDEVDVSGYTTIRNVEVDVLKDTLYVRSQVYRQLYLKMNLTELFDVLMHNCGVENYRELSLGEISRLRKPFVYKDDEIVLIFSALDFRVVGEKRTLFHVNVEYALTRSKSEVKIL